MAVKLVSWTVEDKIRFPKPKPMINNHPYDLSSEEEDDDDIFKDWEASVNPSFSMDKIKDEEFTFQTIDAFLRPQKEFLRSGKPIPGLETAKIEIVHNEEDPNVYFRFEIKKNRGRCDCGGYKTLHLEVSFKSKDDCEESDKVKRVWHMMKAFEIPLQKRDGSTDCQCQETALFLHAELCNIDVLKDYMTHYLHESSTGFFRLELTVQVSVKLSKYNDTIPEKQEEHSLAANPMNFMKKLLSEKMLSDFNIHVGEMTFACHKNILAAQSEVFAAMFDSKMSETNSQMLEIKDMSEAGVEAFLKYLYYKDVEEPVSNCVIALELFKAANKYQIKDLEIESRNILCSMAAKKFDAKTALELFEYGGMLEGCKNVENKAARVFKENVGKYGETDEFETLVRCAKPTIVAKLFETMASL